MREEKGEDRAMLRCLERQVLPISTDLKGEG